MNKLIDAYSNNEWEHRYYLDIETGKVVMDLDESLFDEPESEWDENTNIDRYLEIPRATSTDWHHLMQQFARQVEGEKGQQLMAALDHPEPLQHFKDVLVEASLENAWIVFETDYFKEQVLDWLDVEELSYEELLEKSQSLT